MSAYRRGFDMDAIHFRQCPAFGGRFGLIVIIMVLAMCNSQGQGERNPGKASERLPVEAPGKEGFGLTAADTAFLLKIARGNIVSYMEKGTGIQIAPDDVPEPCKKPAGVFVTLAKNGAFRACMGTLFPEAPLYRAVLDAAYRAAFQDWRIGPLAAAELQEIVIDIAVITPHTPIASIDEIVIGRDGIVVEYNGQYGIFLPEVASARGYSREEFLIWACRKAGLPDYMWRQGARVSTFRTFSFAEGGARH
ncbi:MAG: AmmeMemoRadiSam system protein A [Spirochaetes bacterium]|nr:MAG: AmmeMemoRadiSam system protein A [Spirochaetota bacterium]